MVFSGRARALLGAAVAGLAAVAVLTATSSAFAASSQLPQIHPGRVLLDAGVRSHLSAAAVNPAAAVSSVPRFTAKVTDSGKSYSYTIVGKNPAKAGSGATTIKTELIPLAIVMPNSDTFDPTVANSCDPGASNVTRAQNSPVFSSTSWTFGATSVGTGQYIDAFNRAEFWKYAQPAGVSPNYAVNLSVTVEPKITVSVPSTYAAEAASPCGNGKLGAIEINWFDGYVQSTLLPSLVSKKLAGPTTFPVFLLGNVVEYVGVTTQCCVLGYHNAYSPTASSVQTYAVTTWDTSQDFAGSSDVSTLSHEVGEWANDPFTNNPTRAWGHIGQVSGCQSNLEVGDPLSGTTFAVTMNGYTYHPQELAFLSWFYRQSPSLGVNGWYSNQGTFTSTQGTCV